MKNIDLNRCIIIIDKPSGPTSFQVTDFVRKQLSLGKASHFGTLDPKVTGVLPVALGRAAKLTGYFSRQDKEYVGIMHFHQEVELEKIREVIKKRFLGKIKQLPPLKSRVRRELREREIKEFEILEQQGQDFLFKVECEAGTYIRKLVHDLGKELGINAHMTELRRTRASVFKEKDVVNLYQFTEAVQGYKQDNPENLNKMLIPLEIITKIMPSLEIKKGALDKLFHGSPIYADMVLKSESFKKEEFLAIVSHKRLIEIAKAILDSSSLNREEAIVAKPETVFN